MEKLSDKLFEVMQTSELLHAVEEYSIPWTCRKVSSCKKIGTSNPPPLANITPDSNKSAVYNTGSADTIHGSDPYAGSG